MASLVVLERHLLLNLTEIKDADKIPFLDSPVSPTGLFGPAVESFAERFTATEKTSQEMRHFLPKRSSSAVALSRPKMAPTQQPAKAVSPAVQLDSKPEHRHSRLARRHPPKRQGPWPKIVLDPMPRWSSKSMGQEEKRAKSRCSWTTPQKASTWSPHRFSAAPLTSCVPK